ncbi:succinate-CoA ligase [Paraphaeosphaeria sporulosa]|uniref:Succinate--CoA ligase [ADP-forming] subunit beta, mitochondrial n=1 Tax=Paraphaeosphaeria sporulosa TaxID=1460663 RepID=A0A177C4Y3_9PLEO|nr:succinate-CoA ligase [Paraphaeosphaeria sporulosa]OAG02221.1 succinate-CoA ligase [Paraphaeosphaeria sporulosa]
MLRKSGYSIVLARQTSRRYLSLHEYQSQNLLKTVHIPVPRGELARSPAEAECIATSLGGPCILKSQIQKGGRGKGLFSSGLRGGIQKVDDAASAGQMASQMLGHRLVTKQTGEKGLQVNKIYVAETIEYQDEWYLAMTIDRERYQPAIILSKSGGVDIESVAKSNPEKLLTFNFELTKGITPELVSRIASALETTDQETHNLGDILQKMHKLFISKEATLLEINPLVRSSDSTFTCLDAKFSFDNAAEKRQPELFALRDVEQEQGDEVEAEKYGLVYIKLEGNIGNVVNGAGLAMATNDAIAHYGGASANFLDAGGQATTETMKKAFEIIMRDRRVQCIFVNIYGGIIRCDMIAESIIGAAAELGPLRMPVVVRLQGTNSAEGLQMVEEANLGLRTESDFGKAAQLAVQLSNTHGRIGTERDPEVANAGS